MSEPVTKKRKKGISATKRTMDECERRGWIAQVVEQRIPHTFITRDLFGIIDIVAITPDGIMGIQATAGSNNHALRMHKARAEPRLAAWLAAGAAFAVWSWAKRGARGKPKTWTLREEHIVSGMEQSVGVSP